MSTRFCTFGLDICAKYAINFKNVSTPLALQGGIQNEISKVKVTWEFDTAANAVSRVTPMNVRMQGVTTMENNVKTYLQGQQNQQIIINLLNAEWPKGLVWGLINQSPFPSSENPLIIPASDFQSANKCLLYQMCTHIIGTAKINACDGVSIVGLSTGPTVSQQSPTFTGPFPCL